jgi:hypothetical protein
MLPATLTVPALKRRIGKELSADDALLSELLEEALIQAQAPAPLGSGRLLVPDPPLDDEGNDTGDPVERTFAVKGRQIVIPDARSIESVVVDPTTSPTTLTEGDGYSVMRCNGVIVRLTLGREHRYLWDDDGPCSLHRFNSAQRQHYVTVTGRFGITPLPGDLRKGILHLAARAYHEMNAQYADQVAVADGMGVQSYFRQLPPPVKLAFANYELPSGLIGLP